jgi:hypothetical protein
MSIHHISTAQISRPPNTAANVFLLGLVPAKPLDIKSNAPNISDNTLREK